MQKPSFLPGKTFCLSGTCSGIMNPSIYLFFKVMGGQGHYFCWKDNPLGGTAKQNKEIQHLNPKCRITEEADPTASMLPVGLLFINTSSRNIPHTGLI